MIAEGRNRGDGPKARTSGRKPARRKPRAAGGKPSTDQTRRNLAAADAELELLRRA